MKKQIFTVAAIGLSALMLAACTTTPPVQTEQPMATATPVSQNDSTIQGQIDISDDAVTAREATMSGKATKAPSTYTVPPDNSR